MNFARWRLRAVDPTPVELPKLIHSDSASRHSIRTALAAGEVYRVRAGAYAPVPNVTGSAADRLRAFNAISAAQKFVRNGAVFSHLSAAMVWGLPCIDWSGLVHISDIRRHRRTPEGLRWHWVDVTASDQTVISGLPITTLARTAVDCARLLPPDQGLAIVDGALRVGTDRSEMLRCNAQLENPRFRQRADAVIRGADVGAESPGESLLRHHLTGVGWPNVHTQVEVRCGLHQYFLDVADVQRRIAFEFDGLSKYHASALREEKVREHRLRSQGWSVERFMWSDFSRPHNLKRRLRGIASAHGVELRPVGKL